MSGRILLTGGSGQLGRKLLELEWPNGCQLDAPARQELDLADPEALVTRVRNGGYAAVINGGAFTAVDAAEKDPLAAWRANALAPAALSAASRETSLPIIHISTDYVFDGSGDAAWTPDAPIAPLSVYGASKAAGELAVRGSGARHAILRTAWVVSEHGHNFIKTMLRFAAERDEVGVVADQYGSPTAAGDLAAAVRAVTLRFISDPEQRSGVWHVANAGFATWHALADHVFAEAARIGHRVPRLKALATSDYPTPARRPTNSRLDTARLAQDFGITLPPWQPSVADIVRAVLKERSQ